MSRSNWKGPYVKPNYLNFKLLQDKEKHLYLMSRNSEILPKFVGIDFKIYNGKKYFTFIPTNSMIGHKFGEFVPTRAKFNFKKKSKK